MNEAVHEFLTSLAGARDWNRQFAEVKAWAEGGRTDDLLAASAALTEESRTPGVEDLVRNSILDSVGRALALTPGLLQAEAAFQVLQDRVQQSITVYRRRPQTYYQAEMASLLAQGQTSFVLAALFEQHGPEPAHSELLACLVQEIILRSISVAGPATEFWTRIAGSHPLGSLPLTLLPCESRFSQFLPNYNPQTKSYRTPGPNTEAVKPLPPPVEMSICWTEVEVSAEEKVAIEAATANWELESYGKSEVRLFQSDVAVPPPALTDRQVLSLPLESLAGASLLDLWHIPYSAADAVAVLFSAACTGGAYSNGQGGAYGRLSAWRSAGALTGADSGAGVKDAAALVSECAWFFCIAKSAWFYDVAWDIGLLALRLDGKTLAVLAATDTD